MKEKLLEEGYEPVTDLVQWGDIRQQMLYNEKKDDIKFVDEEGEILDDR